MSLKEEFDRGFQPVLESISLPERLAERYTPESCIACREDSEVWLLRDGPGGLFILKVDRTGARDLPGEFALMQRLPRELEGRVPRPVDCFREGAAWYLLRTHLPGQPLAEAWEPGDAGRCVELGQKLCALLERLHGLEEPVIHRDIKPENIILTPEGEPGLIDFGIARTYKEGQGSDTIFMGTRNTAPPEQYGYAQTDRRADIYSLGMTLRWMLTGSYRPEAMERADCPEGLKRCLRKATAFDPQDRYDSARELGRALSASLKPPRRKWLLTAACLALVLALAALCRPQEKVTFGSALLEQAVRAELDKPEGIITPEDLERVERLAVVGQNLLGENQDYDCRIFGYVDGVPQVDEPHGDVCDLSVLSRMPNLKTLYLCQQEIEDLSPLSGLPLEELYLAENYIEDLSPLEALPDLQVLCLGSNPAHDLTPLSSLSRLRKLNLDSTDGTVDSLAPLARLHLQELRLCNQFPADGDWSALRTLNEVEELWLWDPPAKALEVLPDMRSLRSLSVGELGSENFRLLRAVVSLDSLSLFSGIESLDGLEQLENLRSLHMVGMEGMSLEPAAALSYLEFISVLDCREMNYAPLLRIPALETVEVWDELCRQELERDCPQGARMFEIAEP